MASGYNDLVKWFTDLNLCFYRNRYWASGFFTEKIKAAGNAYCISAMVISLGGILLSLGRVNKLRTQPVKIRRVNFESKLFAPAFLCLIVATAAWF